MSEELKITKEHIKKLVGGLSSCPEAREAIEDAFPEVFEKKERWVDVTHEISWETKDYPGTELPYLLCGVNSSGEEMAYINGTGRHICYNYEKEYRIEQEGETFRILKKT